MANGDTAPPTRTEGARRRSFAPLANLRELLRGLERPARAERTAELEPLRGKFEDRAAHYADLWRLAPSAMRRLESAYLEAQTFPERSRGRAFCHEQVIATVTAAIAVARSEPAAEKTVAAILGGGAGDVSHRLADATDRTARRTYAYGLLVGVVVSVALLVLIFILAQVVAWAFNGRRGEVASALTREDTLALRDALVCVGGGAFGAALSVLLRLARTDRLPARVSLGASFYRIALGWGFAIALLALIKGGIITVFDDPTPASSTGAEYVKSWFFWGGLGLLAGFNERWARDLITRRPDDERPARGSTGADTG